MFHFIFAKEEQHRAHTRWRVDRATLSEQADQNSAHERKSEGQENRIEAQCHVEFLFSREATDRRSHSRLPARPIRGSP
jgi:hypothetical protein